MIRQIFISVVLFCCGVVNASSQQNLHNLMKLPPFERAVCITKYYEQWHTRKDYPYIGYGHRIRPGENLTYPITEYQADSILRSDLRRNCALFRQYGADSLLLGCVSYNCGCASLLGSRNKPKSMVLKKLDIGNRNILFDLLGFCHWKGKKIASIERRRYMEFLLLYVP